MSWGMLAQASTQCPLAGLGCKTVPYVISPQLSDTAPANKKNKLEDSISKVEL